MRLHLIRSLALLFCLGSAARADIEYQFAVDTSSISGTSGSLDLQFNPGPLTSQAASLQILNFTSDGTPAGGPSETGDVSGGPLPAALTFDNGTAFNDYFEGFTFGSSINFEVRLFGPAVNSPDGTSASGSTFGFSMFSDAAGTIPALTTDVIDGFGATVGVNPDGTATVTSFSPQTSVAPVSAVPEPSNMLLVGIAGILIRVLRPAKT